MKKIVLFIFLSLFFLNIVVYAYDIESFENKVHSKIEYLKKHPFAGTYIAGECKGKGKTCSSKLLAFQHKTFLQAKSELGNVCTGKNGGDIYNTYITLGNPLFTTTLSVSADFVGGLFNMSDKLMEIRRSVRLKNNKSPVDKMFNNSHLICTTMWSATQEAYRKNPVLQRRLLDGVEVAIFNQMRRVALVYNYSAPFLRTDMSQAFRSLSVHSNVSYSIQQRFLMWKGANVLYASKVKNAPQSVVFLVGLFTSGFEDLYYPSSLKKEIREFAIQSFKKK